MEILDNLKVVILLPGLHDWILPLVKSGALFRSIHRDPLSLWHQFDSFEISVTEKADYRISKLKLE